MNKIALLIFIGGVLYGGPLCVNTPNNQIDGIPLCADAPGLGIKLILPAGDFDAGIGFEDLPGGVCPTGLVGDCDFNDAVVKLTGRSGVLALQLLGGITAFTDHISWNPATPWIPGTEVIIYDHVSTTGLMYSTGPADRQPDGMIHAWVKIEEFNRGQVPEPGTFGLLALGGGMVFARWLRRHRA